MKNGKFLAVSIVILLIRTETDASTSEQSMSAQSTVENPCYPSSESFEPEAQKLLFRRLAEMRTEKERGENEDRVPIFVITCDRISVLIKSLLSYYTRIANPIEVIIHDNHTTYPPTQDFLNRLEEAGVSIYRSGTDVTHDRALSNLSATIAHWYKTNNSRYYVVTDPDIEIEEGSADILDILAHLLDENPHMNVTGPMLRRDDLPDHYPLKAQVQKQQAGVYRGYRSWNVPWGSKRVIVQDGWIDTCFGMYRRDFTFHNYNRALQTYDPYQARHLDWYIDPLNLAPDQLYYLYRNNPVGHWGSTWLHQAL